MENNSINTSLTNAEIRDNLIFIKLSLENLLSEAKKEVCGKNLEIKSLKKELENLHNLTDGNRQLINKLLADISKLQNDVEWYKKTYVQRSLFGTIFQKILRP